MHALNFIPGSQPYIEAMQLRDPAFEMTGTDNDGEGEADTADTPAKEPKKEPAEV